MIFFSRKHKNISTSPEISTRSPRLIKPSWWLTNRLPKPSQRQLAHLSTPVHSLKGREASPLDSPISTWHRDAAHRPHMPPQHDSLHSAPPPELYRSSSALSRHVSTSGLERHHSHALVEERHPHQHSQMPRRTSSPAYAPPHSGSRHLSHAAIAKHPTMHL